MPSHPVTSGIPEKLLADVLSEIVKRAVAGALDLAKRRFPGIVGPGFETSAATYAEGARRLYGEIGIFDSIHPAGLSRLFVDARLTSDITAQRRVRAEDVTREGGADAWTAPLKSENAFVTVDREPRLLVLGGPGSGKTTLLRRTLFRVLDEHKPAQTLPSFVSLKLFAESGISLEEFIALEFQNCGLQATVSFVSHALIQGRLLLLFDGLDEVPADQLTHVLNALQSHCDRFPKNRAIVSCRGAFYSQWLKAFAILEIVPFDDTQIDALAVRWFADEPAAAKLFLQRVHAQPETHDLARTPLFLTMMCLAYDETGKLDTKAEIYKDALDALMKKWDAHRRISREGPHPELSARTRELLLMRLSAEALRSRKTFWKRDELVQSLERAASEGVRTSDQALLDGDKVLSSVEIQNGVLVHRGRDVFSFAHVAFMEFYAARFFEQLADRAEMYRELAQHLEDESWSNVITLVCALLPVADEFLRHLQDAIESATAAQKLPEQASEILRHLEVRTAYSPVATERTALGYVFSQLLFEAAVVDAAAHADRSSSAYFRHKLLDIAFAFMKEDGDALKGDAPLAKVDDDAMTADFDFGSIEPPMSSTLPKQAAGLRAMAARIGLVEFARLTTMVTRLKPRSMELELMLDIRSERPPVVFQNAPGIVRTIARFGRSVRSTLHLIRLMYECLNSGCVLRTPPSRYVDRLQLLVPSVADVSCE